MPTSRGDLYAVVLGDTGVIDPADETVYREDSRSKDQDSGFNGLSMLITGSEQFGPEENGNSRLAKALGYDDFDAPRQDGKTDHVFVRSTAEYANNTLAELRAKLDNPPSVTFVESPEGSSPVVTPAEKVALLAEGKVALPSHEKNDFVQTRVVDLLGFTRMDSETFSMIVDRAKELLGSDEWSPENNEPISPEAQEFLDSVHNLTTSLSAKEATWRPQELLGLFNSDTKTRSLTVQLVKMHRRLNAHGRNINSATQEVGSLELAA